MAYSDKAKRDAYQRAYYLAHREEKIARTKAWKEAHPERARELSREATARQRERRPDAVKANHHRWKNANPESVREHNRRSRLAFRYSLTVIEYETMNSAQRGRCAVCGKEETHRGRNGEVTRLAVDHDHATGSLRALLCHSCNTGIGSFYDSPDLLIAAAEYIKRFRE